jgi:hypothetical protein
MVEMMHGSLQMMFTHLQMALLLNGTLSRGLNLKAALLKGKNVK